MNDEVFAEIIEHCIDTLPDEFKLKLENVVVRYQDSPTPDQLRAAKVSHGLLLGLYEGIPRTKGGHYAVKLPDTITLFKIPLLTVSQSDADLADRVRDTLLHEIAHYFGFTEHEIQEVERLRKLKKD